MASKKKKQKKQKADESRPGSVISSISRFVFTLIALLLVLAVSAYLFARTEGFRALVSDQVEKAIGVRLTASSSRITWNGGIVFEDVRSEDQKETEGAGLVAARVRIDASLVEALRGRFVAALRAVHVQDWRLQFSLDEAGVWQPASLGKVSDWLGRWGTLALPEDEVGGTPAPAEANDSGDDSEPPVRPRIQLADFKRTLLRIQNGDLIWSDRSGNALADIRGVTFKLTPLELPTHPAAHYHLQVESATATDGSNVRDMDVELFQTGLTYFVINLEAVRQAARRAQEENEEIPPPVLDRTDSTSRAQEESDPDREILEELIREELRDALSEG